MDTKSKKIEDELNLEILSDTTLLYVENNKDIQNESKVFFQKFFKEVVVASNASEALQTATSSKKIDILLTEVELPTTSQGIEFLKELRAKNDLIPIVLCHNLSDVNTLFEVIKLKINDYILKPLKYNTTIKILNKILLNEYNKKAVENKQKELEVYKDILDKQNLISETDLSGVITYVNDIFCEVSGYTRDELIGKPHNIVRHPDNSHKIFEDLWNTIQAKNVWRGKIKNKAKDGSAYYIKSTIFPIFDEEGNIKKYVASRFLITDDEEEKQTLKKYILQQKTQSIKNEKTSQEKYKKLLEEAVVLNEKKYATYLNDMQNELKNLRSKINDDKGRILNLENKLSASEKKFDDSQHSFLEKISKLRNATALSIEKYEKFKKQNDALTKKLAKAQESIKTYQEYIDEYRAKINDLNDVIASYEKDLKKQS